VGQRAILANVVPADVLLARMMCGPDMQRIKREIALVALVSLGSERRTMRQKLEHVCEFRILNSPTYADQRAIPAAATHSRYIAYLFVNHESVMKIYCSRNRKSYVEKGEVLE